MRNFLLSLLLVGSAYGGVYNPFTKGPSESSIRANDEKQYKYAIVSGTGTGADGIHTQRVWGAVGSGAGWSRSSGGGNFALGTTVSSEYGKGYKLSFQDGYIDAWYVYPWWGPNPPGTGWSTSSTSNHPAPTITFANEFLSNTLPAPSTNGTPSVSWNGWAAASYPFTAELTGDLSYRPLACEWTRQAVNGDTIALTGFNLTTQDNNGTPVPSAFVISDSGGNQFSHTPVLLSGDQCAITLTNALATNDLYYAWPTNSIYDVGQPFAINKTEAWWVGPDNVESGKTFSVYGRNLQLGSTNTYLYIAENSTWITNSGGNPYKADFVADLSPGTYTIWVHNGKGRQYGWADSLDLTVRSPIEWSGTTSTWVNVVDDHNADNTGASDTRSDIASALSAAKSGDTVYFPAGTYAIGSKISDTLTGVRIIGDGTNSVITEYNGIGSWIFDLKLFDCEMRNLKIKSGDYDDNNTQLIELNGSERLFVSNVVFSTQCAWEYVEGRDGRSKPNAANHYEVDGVIYQDCDFILSGIWWMSKPRQVFFRDCNFYGILDNNALVQFQFCTDVSFTGCTAQHYDMGDPSEQAGWGQGRFVLFNAGGSGAQKNIYYGNNQTIDFTPRPLCWNQNTGEDFMWESSGPDATGMVYAATSNTLLTRDFNFSANDGNRVVAIVRGKGVGQMREVTYNNNGSMEVDPPWSVVPDTSSLAMVGSFAYRAAVYSNYFDGKDWDGQELNVTAESGVEAYGGAGSLVVDGNTSTDAETAFYVFSGAKNFLKDNRATYPPNFFNIYQNNSMSNGYHLMRCLTLDYPDTDTSPNPPIRSYWTTICGNVYRNNTATNIESYAWSFEASYENDLTQGLSVYDNNSMTNFGNAIGYFRRQPDSSSGSYSQNKLNCIFHDVWVGNTTNGVSWP